MDQFMYTGTSNTNSNLPKLDKLPLSNRNSATKKHFKFVDIIIFEFLLLKYSLKHCITKNVTIWVDIIFLVLLLLKLKAIFVRVIIVSGALCSGPI